MRHLCGGAALGFILGPLTVGAGKDKPIGCFLLAFLGAIAAWGILG